MSLKGKKEK